MSEQQLPRGEQRGSVRYPCGPETSCRLIVIPQIEFWARRVQNISAAGITLISDRALTLGGILDVELHRQSRRFACKRQMKLVYQFKEQGGDYIQGGAFADPLAEDELQALR